MSESITLAVDAMGGDYAPDIVLEGTHQALEADPDLIVALCGAAEVVKPFAAAHERCVAQSTTEVITMGDHPAEAVRRKKDSSIVVGCRLVKEGRAQGFVSMGSTGACLAASTLVIGRIKGVKRPAIGQIIPAYEQPVLLLDVGANADCKPEYLLQFARMGVIYAEHIMKKTNPVVGLLNIGEEETKGSAFALETHRLLTKDLINFAGNCEGGDLLAGSFDVVVTDGFTGNITLKSIEGTSKILFKYLKDGFLGSLKTKIGAMLLKDALHEIKQTVNPDTYGGAPLLGVRGACVIGHGSSNELAVKNAIDMASRTVRERVSDIIAATFHDRQESRVSVITPETNKGAFVQAAPLTRRETYRDPSSAMEEIGEET